MGNAGRVLEIVDAALSEGLRRGLGDLVAEDERLDGRSVRLGNADKLNFSSCSYLGLELDPRLKAAAIDAIERYGTQFSCSRAYLAAPAYEELEARLGDLTGGHAMVTANTTLAHFSALPAMVGERDAVILDHQVHHSVQMVIPHLRQLGAHVEYIRHDRLDQLEERILDLAPRYEKIWFLADGVYSMFGDLAPMASLRRLLHTHEQLHLYIDDAHGMSWLGTHGRGLALEELGAHDRCVVALSLNKAFGAGGGALVFSNPEARMRIRKLGGPMVFTGPVQPPLLGAAIASAKIHLSPEIEVLKRELVERIRATHAIARELDVPLANECEVPIRFVALGRPVVAYDMAQQLLERGFVAGCAVFPAVPSQRCGVRFTLTRHQHEEDIRHFLTTVAELLPETLARNGSSRAEIETSFELTPQAAPRRRRSDLAPARSALGRVMNIQRETTIRALDREEWNACLGERGSFSWEGLAYLEDVFGRGEQDDENHWGFRYYVVRDETREPVLATFFTDGLWKDDLIEAPEVSRRVEEMRRDDPRFLTSRVFAMGSQLTEGNHLYLRRDADWQAAMAALLEEVTAESAACKASSVVLRDLPSDDPEFDRILTDAGFTRMAGPTSMGLAVNWNTWEDFVARLSKNSRRHQRRAVAPHDDSFELDVLRPGDREISADDWAHLHQLYRNVQARSLELNTFPLPEHFLPTMLQHDGWEILTLTLSETARARSGIEIDRGPHAFVAAYVGPEAYVPLVVGLDYGAVEAHGAYRQCIRRIVERAEELGAERILFGMGAELEKSRFGASPIERAVYVSSQDHYAHDVLGLLAQAGPKESPERQRR
jgi:7-keto-8-aminopelargonate synthetase-like enzyme